MYDKQFVAIKDDVKRVSLKSYAPFLFKDLGEHPMTITANITNKSILFEVDSFKFEKKLDVRESKHNLLLYILNCNNTIRLKQMLSYDVI